VRIIRHRRIFQLSAEGEEEEKKMERLRYFAMGTVVVVALTASGQQSGPANESRAAASAEHQQATTTQAWVPSVEQQMKVLTDKLDLSADQRAKIRPILQRLHDFTEKVVQDPSLSHEARLAKVRPERYKAHDDIGALLNDDQKQKLEEYLKGPHPEMHGNLGGSESSQPQ
jgi:hypothetical protein